MRINKGRDSFFIRAVRRRQPHPAVTDFRLCREFGWTPLQLKEQPAKIVQQFIVILNELDRQMEEEQRKAEKEARRI